MRSKRSYGARGYWGRRSASQASTVYKRIDALNHGSFVFITAWMLYILIRQSETIVTRPQESLRRLNRSLKAYSECNQSVMRASDEHIALMRDEIMAATRSLSAEFGDPGSQSNTQHRR